MSKGGSGSGRWSRCMRAPVRLLRSIRDLYVRGMTACAGKVGQYRGAGIACPAFSDFAYDRRSFSSSSGRSDDLDLDEDLRELIRAASRARRADVRGGADVRRSQSAVVGRIDEDRPCEFEEEVKVGSSLIFPRSSSGGSHGVGIKKRGSKANVFA